MHDRTLLLALLADRALGNADADADREIRRLLPAHPDVRAHEMDDLVRDLAAALGPSTTRRLAVPGPLARLLARAGWQELAAAAAVVLAVLVGLQVGLPLLHPVRAQQQRVEVARDRLLGNGAAILPFAPWGDLDAPLVRGDLVWSARRQVGVLRFEALAENRPDRVRYHVRVHTADGDTVPAGVFDARKLPSGWLVRVEPDTPVQDPIAFEVTLESVGPTGAIHRRVALAPASPAPDAP